MVTPSVCVVIPAYNSEATLLRALDSVVAQTLAPSEILVVDDASTDATPLLAKNYRNAAVNVISMRSNVGASGARNQGVRTASADLVAFLDADDEWLPTKLEKQVQLILANQNSTFCSCGSSLISPDGSNLGDIYRGQTVTTGPDAWKALLRDNYVTTPSVLVWRRHLLALGGFDESLKIAEDQDMWIRLAARGGLSYVPEMLVHVHDRRSSLSGGSFDEQMTYTLPMIERHLERFVDRLTGEDCRSILGAQALAPGTIGFQSRRWGGRAEVNLAFYKFGLQTLGRPAFPANGQFGSHMAQASNSAKLRARTRQIAKSLAIGSGAMGLYHRVKHREVLTVLMLHRVLPQNLISAYDADEEYTISTALLEHLLTFVTAHYNVVSLSDVLQSRNRITPLPPRPLLITFDDGWDDNALFAAPILSRMNAPWALFVATDAMETGSHWWQETLLAALRSGNADYESLKEAALNVLQEKCPELPDDQALSILVLFGKLSRTERDNLIATCCGNSSNSQRPRDMATWETLRSLHENGVEIGSHGTSHLPLTLADNPEREISESRSALEKSLGKTTTTTMSFPHGRYNASIVDTARKQGVKLLFTSDPILNKCWGGWLESDVIGRISISAADVASPAGKLQFDKMMPWLMLRRHSAA